MAFQQLYYTSCEHGLSGHAGYQFNAVTPGVAATVMREVEHLTVYELPPLAPRDDGEAHHPVNLCHTVDAATGSLITARVVAAGTDFSGRPGNYFAHAIVTSDPAADFGRLLAVELWEAPMWSRRQAAGTSLPEISGPPPRGKLDRSAVADFLAARAAPDVLPLLLSAAWRAVEGERPVLLMGEDSTANAHWIAAVSFLLDHSLARRISFTTYSNRPDYTRLHLIGTVPETGVNIAGLTDAFAVFDLVHRSVIPDVQVHPLARLVCLIGVRGAEALWMQASLLAEGSENSLGAWYPAVAAAAGLAGVELTAGDAATVAGWLPGSAGRLPAAYVEAVAAVIVDGHAAVLPGGLLSALLDVVLGARAADLAGRVEEELVSRALITFRDGGTPEASFRPATDAGRGRMARALAALLERAPPRQAFEMLRWAAGNGVDVPGEAVERWAQQMLGPALVAGTDPSPLISQAAPAAHAALLRGLTGYLNGLPEDEVLGIFDGPAGRMLRPTDFRDHPDLRELRIVSAAHAGGRDGAETLAEIVSDRVRRGRPVVIDDRLIRLIWGDRPWSAGETRQILGMLGPDRGDGSCVAARLAGVLIAEPDPADHRAWLDLVAELPQLWPIDSLPPAAAARVREFERVAGFLKAAADGAPEGDVTALLVLFTQAQGAGAVAGFVRAELPEILLTAPELPRLLAECPPPVFQAFCVRALELLDPASHREDLAAALFQATKNLGAMRRFDRAEALDYGVLRPALGRWRARDLRAVRRHVVYRGSRNLAGLFDLWRSQQRGFTRRAVGSLPRQAKRGTSGAVRLITRRAQDPGEDRLPPDHG